MHAVCGYPVKSTWLKAIKAGNYCTWPGLSAKAKAVEEYSPKSDETQQGHMKGLRQGLRSTKERAAMETDKHPKEATKKEHDVYMKVLDIKETIYTDKTGQFPFTSSKGNRYGMVAIHVDASSIFMEPMKNRTSGHMVETYQRIHSRMIAAGLGIKKHYLDNEASEEYIRKPFKVTSNLI